MENNADKAWVDETLGIMRKAEINFMKTKTHEEIVVFLEKLNEQLIQLEGQLVTERVKALLLETRIKELEAKVAEYEKTLDFELGIDREEEDH